jgi:uncharacterized membrane protein
MHALYLVAVWLHLLALAVWLGGMVFLALVLVPATRRPEQRATAPALFHQVATRFRWVGWACLAILIVTGLFALGYRGYGLADAFNGRLWQGAFGHTLAAKLVLVGVILAVSAAHDFWLGPRAVAQWQRDPHGAEAQRLRRQASWIGRLTLLLALGVSALGVLLVRGGLVR